MDSFSPKRKVRSLPSRNNGKWTICRAVDMSESDGAVFQEMHLEFRSQQEREREREGESDREREIYIYRDR